MASVGKLLLQTASAITTDMSGDATQVANNWTDLSFVIDVTAGTFSDVDVKLETSYDGTNWHLLVEQATIAATGQYKVDVDSSNKFALPLVRARVDLITATNFTATMHLFYRTEK